MIRSSGANIFVTTCLVRILFVSCGFRVEGTPDEVVDAFLGNIQLLSTPIHERQGEIDPEQAAAFNEARKETPKLFENERAGRMIASALLLGKFDSYNVSTVDVQGDIAVVEAEIVGAKFLGVRSEGEETPSRRITFRVVKRGARWYISELLRTK